METTIDSAGRIVVPKVLRDSLGLRPGTRLDISAYGAGLSVIPGGRTAELVEEDGVLVARGTTVVDSETIFGVIDALRR